MDWINSKVGGKLSQPLSSKGGTKLPWQLVMSGMPQGLMPTMLVFSNSLDDWKECNLCKFAGYMNWEGWTVH